MSCTSGRAANMLSAAMCIPSRSRSCLSGLPRRKLRTRASYSTDSGLRIHESEAQWLLFFSQSCGSGIKPRPNLPLLHKQHIPSSKNRSGSRSFSVKACSEAPAFLTETAWLCPKESLAQQHFLGSPQCVLVDNIHRGKKSSSLARIRSKNTPSHSGSSEPFSKHGLHYTSRSKQQLLSPETSIWSCRRAPHHQIRNLHSTRSRRSFVPREGTLGSGLSLDEKRSIVAELRHKALVRALVPALWAVYRRIVKADAINLLQSDDVVVLFQTLCKSHYSEEAVEMMIQVALDINEMGKQLPQASYEILTLQAIDHLPAEQVKALLGQIQGRRRFVTEIVQVCETNAEMKRVFDLYRQLVQASFDVDGYSTYFQSRKDRAENLGKMVTQWIRAESTQVSPKVVERLLVFLLDRHVLDQVYTTIGKLSKDGFQFSQSFYTTAIHRFGREQEFDYMDMTLDYMRKQGLEPTVSTYSAIIDAHSKAGNLREAQRAYQDVLAAGLTPTETVFGPMVEAVGKMGDYDMTRQLVNQMNSSGVDSNEFTFSALLQSLAHDSEKSLELFQEMTKQVQPNTVNFNLLIRTFQHNADLDGAFKVLFAARGDVDGAEGFWSEMVHTHKVTPNTHAYASMMQVYCTAEDMLSAQTVYREMIQAGIMPNEVIFGTLLTAYARRGDLTQMLSIYDAMRAEGLKPNSYIYSNLLFGLVKDGDMKAARRLFQNMEEDGFGQNVLAQTIMMKGYADQGNIKEAQLIYKSMIESGLIPNYMTYATLMHAHIKRGEKRQSRLFLNKIIRAPGFVDLEADDEEGEEATDLGINQSHDRAVPVSLEHMERDHFQSTGHLSTVGTERKPLKAAARPNLLMAFTPLMDAYAKEGNALATRRMFELIKGRKMEPNTVTYTILMDGFRRAGDIESVLSIWNELFDRFSTHWKDLQSKPESQRPSSLSKKKVAVEWLQDRLSTKAVKLQRIMQQPVSITLDALCYSGRVLEAQAIWGQLEKVGFEFDSSNWNDYCVTLARNGRVLEACRIVQDKLLAGFISEKDLGLQQPRSTGPNSSTPLEASPHHDTRPVSKLPGSLFYPRPRTFAALADSLEELLISKDEKSKTRFEDYLLDPVVDRAQEANASLEKSRKEIESKLEAYPHPFKQLDSWSRQVLWGLVRTEYPRVLDALGEGMLVASKRMVALSAPSSVESEEVETKALTKRRQRDQPVVNQEKPKDDHKNFSGFREWRRLKSVMKDMERKQFVDERKQFVEEREKQFELLKGRKPT
ncbi:hypothetical protein BGZ82_011340 [Podila clonocystis]|nr:hypothetical protein BGZ82_011340 [Podila clonocystis]